MRRKSTRAPSLPNGGARLLTIREAAAAERCLSRTARPADFWHVVNGVDHVAIGLVHKRRVLVGCAPTSHARFVLLRFPGQANDRNESTTVFRR
jgi:hypothetical protein